MNRPSFRLRIALLSAALAGSALVGFSAISWFQIYTAKISRLDAELINQLMRAARISDQEHWQFYADSLPYILGGSHSQPAIALLVQDDKGNTQYQTPALSADQDINQRLVDSLRQVPPLPNRPPPVPPGLEPDRPRSRPIPPRPPQFTTVQTAAGTWRIGAANVPDGRVAIAANLYGIDQEMAAIRTIFVISIPGVLLLIAGGAWLVAGSALRPIRHLTDAIQQMTVQGLDQRLAVGTVTSEFVELIQVFNQMLERLERSFTQASRFSADAAHELKTPLTILQGELERTLQQVAAGSEVQQRLSNLLDEVRRLSVIMRKLLLLSLADAGHMSLYRVDVEVSALLSEMVEDVELLAPQLTVHTNIVDRLWVQGDRDLLIQVLQNLFSNAIKYNLANGWIQLRAQQTGTTIRITIANASSDIPARDRDLIFDRFHRGDPARTRKIEGIGLGLSLAREIARAHHGDLTLDPAAAGQTSFTLTLPLTLREIRKPRNS